MNIESKEPVNWLVGFLALLALLILGRPLLVPLVFTLLIWTVLNALADTLLRFKLPRWLAWLGSLALLLAGIYLVGRIVGDEAAQFAVQAPGYVARLEQLTSERLAPLHLGIDIGDVFSRSDVAGMLTRVAGLLGSSAFGLVEVLIYVGFLLAEQNNLATKFERLQTNSVHQERGQLVLHTIARQLQSYLGVYTILSAVMAGTSYVLLVALGVQFAAFWALIIFVLTYIPTIGSVAVVIPALMALVQFGTLTSPLIIVAVLGATHFILMNVIGTVVLGQSLNLSPFAIIIALTFWGLVWGVAGLFLAVPVTAAIAIVCGQIGGLRWISVLLAAPPSQPRKKTFSQSTFRLP